MSNLYYQAPDDSIFEDIKENAVKIWRTYDDTHGYATEKINSIKDLHNVGENYMYMVAMFDDNNQAKLFGAVKHETKLRMEEAIR